jgi:hypothetical protein
VSLNVTEYFVETGLCFKKISFGTSFDCDSEVLGSVYTDSVQKFLSLSCIGVVAVLPIKRVIG